MNDQLGSLALFELGVLQDSLFYGTKATKMKTAILLFNLRWGMSRSLYRVLVIDLREGISR